MRIVKCVRVKAVSVQYGTFNKNIQLFIITTLSPTLYCLYSACNVRNCQRGTAWRQVLRRVLGHGVREGGQLLDVLVVQPLDLEVQVHVVSRLAELMLLVFCAETHGCGANTKYSRQVILAFCLSQNKPNLPSLLRL